MARNQLERHADLVKRSTARSLDRIPGQSRCIRGDPANVMMAASDQSAKYSSREDVVLVRVGPDSILAVNYAAMTVSRQ
jgi:hypothetical protein